MLKNEEMRKNICLVFQYFMPGWNNKEFPFFHKKTLYFLYCEIFRGVTKVLANKIK